MQRPDRKQRLGPPALDAAGFQLWIHGREFPEATDPTDADWLLVTAHCGAEGASVWVSGAIVMASDIERLGKGCAAMAAGELVRAELSPVEPNLYASLELVDKLGHVELVVELTPDHLAQQHQMKFEIDLSYLPGITKQCAAIVAEYPIRGCDAERGD